MALSKNAVDIDHRLERQANQTSEDLARHRWHWTLDESNAGRVSVREYAREVGRSHQTILRYAQGYVAWAGNPGVASLSDAIVKAGVGEEKVAAAEAVAAARGNTLKNVTGHRGPEVRRVLDMARKAAERKGTSVAEEAPTIARTVAKAEQVEAKRKAEKRERLGLRFVEMESLLIAAKRKLTDALTLAHEVEWDPTHRDLLLETVGNVKALLGLVDLALVGSADVDWDAELASIIGEAS